MQRSLRLFQFNFYIPLSLANLNKISSPPIKLVFIFYMGLDTDLSGEKNLMASMASPPMGFDKDGILCSLAILPPLELLPGSKLRGQTLGIAHLNANFVVNYF